MNPSFGSQTKELLTTQIKHFGSKCELDRKAMRRLMTRTGVVDRCFEFVTNKRAAAGGSGRKSSVIRGIAKLDDANFAGTRRAAQCTLILTEGDSAKALAISGTSVVGRDRYGVYVLSCCSSAFRGCGVCVCLVFRACARPHGSVRECSLGCDESTLSMVFAVGVRACVDGWWSPWLSGIRFAASS